MLVAPLLFASAATTSKWLVAAKIIKIASTGAQVALTTKKYVKSRKEK
jgi:hypothetical protein